MSITAIQVLDNDHPIVWSDLPSRTYTDGNLKSINIVNYVNRPRNHVSLAVDADTPFPSAGNYRFRSGGRSIRFNPQPGKTVTLRFIATRGRHTSTSSDLTITRETLTEMSLTPSRTLIDTEWDQNASKLWVYSASLRNVNPTVRYLDSFGIDGSHNMGDSLVFDSGMISSSDWPIPSIDSGMCCDDEGHFYISGRDEEGGGEVVKINDRGNEVNRYSYSAPAQLDAMSFDGTYIWALDVANRNIRCYNMNFVEQNSQRVSLHSSQFGFSTDGIAAMVKGGDYFYIRGNDGGLIKCVNDSGSRETSRDVSLPTARTSVYGLAFDNDQETLLYASTNNTVYASDTHNASMVPTT